jgi:transposase
MDACRASDSASQARRQSTSCRVREVVNGLVYVLSTGCQWRAVPKDLPPRSTLYDYFDLWGWDGTLEQIHEALYVKCREAAGREASPTAAIIDSQSVKSAEKGGLHRSARLRCGQECASTARITNGGRFHPESCRLIRKLASGLAGQPAGSKPRDKGRLGRSSDPTGRNVSEVRAGLERVDAGADPSFARGKPCGQGSNRHTHLPGLPGYWTQHVGRAMRVIEGGLSGSEVSRLQHRTRAVDSDGRRTGSWRLGGRVMPAEGRTLTSGALSTMAR